MTPRDLLLALRDGAEIAPDDLYHFARTLGGDGISDAQAGAFAMGICHHPLYPAARVALTRGMRDSGAILNWQTDRPVIDKHSTGGVGDAVSFLLAPMLSAVGGFVPMISGRGLGHTGGTLDKLEAIPGLKTQFSLDHLRQIMGQTNCAIVAASTQIAPADRRLYGVRDVTGTVRSVDLITASILSKKLAAGLGALILDVKVGTGAVMQNGDDARALARALVDTANGAGCQTAALITDMNQPLLPACGNALEIAEIMRVFAQPRGQRIANVAVALGGELAVMAGLFLTAKGAQDALWSVLENGQAMEQFAKMIHAQGGPDNFTQCPDDYLSIAQAHPITADGGGYITAIDTTKLGEITVTLGGGRAQETDIIDHSVGLSGLAELGQKLAKGDVLGFVHCHDTDATGAAIRAVRSAFDLSEAPPDLPPLVHERIAHE